MKTKTTMGNMKRIFTSPEISNRGLNMSKIYLIALFILPFCSKKGTSQIQLPNSKGNIGTGIFGQISTNGYGTEYLPTVYYKKGRSSYFLAPTIQKQKANLSGGEITFQYALTGKEVKNSECELELFAFLTAGYHYHAMMGKVTERDEQIADPVYTENKISRAHFNSVEAFGGIGLNIPFLKRFKWTNCIGLGGFTSFDFPSRLYYKGQSAGLIVRTGITMDVHIHKKS